MLINLMCLIKKNALNPFFCHLKMAETSPETRKCPITISQLYFICTTLQTVNPLACYRLMAWHNRLLDAKPDPK